MEEQKAEEERRKQEKKERAKKYKEELKVEPIFLRKAEVRKRCYNPIFESSLKDL